MALTVQDFIQAASAGDIHRVKPRDPTEALAEVRARLQAQIQEKKAAAAAAEQQAYTRRIDEMKQAEGIRQFGVTSGITKAQAETSRMQAERADRALLAQNMEGLRSRDPSKQRAAEEVFRAVGGSIEEEPVPSDQVPASPVSVPEDVAEALEKPDITQTAKDVLSQLAAKDPEALAQPGVAQAVRTILKNQAGLQIGTLDPKQDQEEFDARKDKFEQSFGGKFGSDNIGQRLDIMLGPAFVTFDGDEEKALDHILALRKDYRAEEDKDLSRTSAELRAAMMAGQRAGRDEHGLTAKEKHDFARQVRNDLTARFRVDKLAEVDEALSMAQHAVDGLNSGKAGLEAYLAAISNYRAISPGVMTTREYDIMFGPESVTTKIMSDLAQYGFGKVSPTRIASLKNSLESQIVKFSKRRQRVYDRELKFENTYDFEEDEKDKVLSSRFPDLYQASQDKEEAEALLSENF